MKIVLTGAGGMLGHDIKKVFNGTEIIGFTHRSMDITVLDDVIVKIKSAKPDFLIHAAAFTDVDGSELEPEKAFLVNGLGTRNVVMACEETDCPVIYISTDYVFDGEKGAPYNEWDSTNPVNKYGLSKLMGESFVKTLTNKFYIIRTSWLYGRNGKNFVDTILRLLSEREQVEVVHDQTGCPTYTVDLARTLMELIGKGYGTYHITNTGSCSWYDFAAEIASCRGIKKKIIPVTTEQFNRPAKRPLFSVLDNTFLKLEGISELRSWKEAVEEYLAEAEGY